MEDARGRRRRRGSRAAARRARPARHRAVPQILTKHGFWRLGVDRHVGDLAASRSRCGTSSASRSACRSGACSAARSATTCRTYTHLGLGDMKAVYEISTPPPRRRARRAIVARPATTRVKVVCIPYTHYLAGKRDVDKVGAHGLRPSRGGRPRRRDHGRLPRPPGLGARRAATTSSASRRAGRCSSRSRCRPRTLPAWPRSTARSTVPIAAGERLVGRREFEPAIRGRAFDIAQPDICHTGGLFETKKIAAMAETAGIGVAPAQSARADRRRRGAAFRRLDAERRHPGGDVGRGAVVRRGGRVADRSAGPAAGTCRKSPASASRSTKPRSPGIPSSRRSCHARNAVLADGTIVDW